MVKCSKRTPLGSAAAALVLGIAQAGGSFGCLINPKDYPLASNAAGNDGGQAGDDTSSAARPPTAGGGATSTVGNGGANSQSGSPGTNGGSSPGSGGDSHDGGSGGDALGAGGSVVDAGGAAGEPPEQGGSAGQPESVGGSAASAGVAAIGGGSSGATGGGCSGCSVKRVFVTSQTFDGNFKSYGDASDSDGRKGADAVCNNAASQAGLGGKWVAWLSVTGGDAINRVVDVAPWYLVDQTTKVFNTHAQLASAANLPIAMNEHGEIISGPTWTGTTLTGTAHSARCGEWKNNGNVLGAWGDASNAFDWSFKDTQYCSKTAHLYCFEQ